MAESISTINDVLSFLDKLKNTDKTEYSKNAHKPFCAYQKHVKPNGNLNELYICLNTVYKRFSEKYAPTTVRNYMRYLQASLNLDMIKKALDKDIMKIAQKELQDILKECDKLVHAEKGEKSVVAEEDCEDISNIEDAMNTDESVKGDWDLNEIKPEVAVANTELADAKHKSEIYKAQLDCMWRLLDLVFRNSSSAHASPSPR